MADARLMPNFGRCTRQYARLGGSARVCVSSLVSLVGRRHEFGACRTQAPQGTSVSQSLSSFPTPFPFISAARVLALLSTLVRTRHNALVMAALVLALLPTLALAQQLVVPADALAVLAGPTALPSLAQVGNGVFTYTLSGGDTVGTLSLGAAQEAEVATINGGDQGTLVANVVCAFNTGVATTTTVSQADDGGLYTLGGWVAYVAPARSATLTDQNVHRDRCLRFRRPDQHRRQQLARASIVCQPC